MPRNISGLSINQKIDHLNLQESINLAKETRDLLIFGNIERRSFWNIVRTTSTPIIADCTQLCEKVDVIKKKQLHAIRLVDGLLSIDTNYNDSSVTDTLITSLTNKIGFLVDSFSSDNVVIGLSNLQLLNNIVNELHKREYSDDVINKLLYSNYLRILKCNLN